MKVRMGVVFLVITACQRCFQSSLSVILFIVHISPPPPRYVKTCSIWTSLYRVPYLWTCSNLLIMKHVGKRAVTVLLESLLVGTTFFSHRFHYGCGFNIVKPYVFVI